MIIDIGTGVDESIVKWKYNDKDTWCYADIDELIDLYESIIHCKDCIHYESDGGAFMVCRIDDMVVDDTDYCSYGERREL